MYLQPRPQGLCRIAFSPFLCRTYTPYRHSGSLESKMRLPGCSGSTDFPDWKLQWKCSLRYDNMPSFLLVRLAGLAGLGADSAAPENDSSGKNARGIEGMRSRMTWEVSYRSHYHYVGNSEVCCPCCQRVSTIEKSARPIPLKPGGTRQP